ncbi:uncharacterized protein LOC141538270 isoform X1 [Cotesia typhae]|uniref:uncharacterized protein LOC141538270 isoform X1 n=1 Tax=Cotesia typhae TaxID=2053667 RepID=UPI003D695ABD
MYAVENDNYNIVHWLLSKIKDYPELINARDNDGFHVLHYLLPNEKFGQFRYHQKIFFEVKKGQITAELIDAGADIYATVSGNPDTLLLNMAAYRSCLCILKILMNFDVHLSIASKALCNATLPIDPTKYMRIYRNIPGDNPMEVMEKERKLCIEYILQNLVIRRRLRLFVPEEEKKLMDQLIAMELDIQEIVSNYEEEFIRGFKNEEIYYGGKSINLYELMVEVFMIER